MQIQPATASATALVEPESNTTPLHRTSRLRASPRLLLASIAVPGLLAVVAVGMSGAGWVDRWFGGSSSSVATYLVEPISFQVTVTESGELKPVQSENVKCRVEGQSTILFVIPESTHVKKGELLVELASDSLVERLESEQFELRKIETDLQAAIEDLDIQRSQNASNNKKAQIDLEIAKLELQKYIEGDYEQQLNTVNLDIKQTELDIDRKNEELRKNQGLLKRGFVTGAKVEQIKFDLEKSDMILAKHRLSKKILLDYDRPKTEKQKQSDVDRAAEELERVAARGKSREKQAAAKSKQYLDQLDMKQKRYERHKMQLEYTKIYAPVDGIVQYPTSESHRYGGGERIAEGEKVREGQTLVVLPDTTRMIVTARIHEADRHRIREGLPCIIRVPAVPGKSFTGRIKHIDTFADSANRWLNPELKEHTTEILLDGSDAALSPGDSAEVEILVDSVEGALAVPVQCVYTRGARSFVFVQRGRSADPVEIRIGRSNVSLVEITRGISAGDEVLMHADETLLAKLPSIGVSEGRSLQRAVPKRSEHALKAKQPSGRTGKRPKTKR